MIRRDLLVGSGCLALTGAIPARAQQQSQKLPTVAMLLSVTNGEIRGPRPDNLPIRAFIDGLQEHGWVEGRTVEIIRHAVGGDRSQVPALMDELIASGVNVIFLGGTSWLHHAAHQKSRHVPLIAMFADDPISSGFAVSLGRPGGNVTGVTRHAGAELYGKWLQLLRDIVPGISRTAFLAPGSTLSALPRASLPADLSIVPIRVDVAEDIDRALKTIIVERADSLMVPAGPLFHNHARRLAEFSAEQKLPSLSAIREFVTAGGLVSYGPNVQAQFRLAARYVDQILRGAKPGDLPIEQPTEFELIVNLRAAKRLGIEVPPIVLIRADEVIE